MTALLETRNVSKSYGVFRALDQVTMTVHEGELVSVVGPNGAGKTTLVNLLTGLLEPTAGEVLFMGRTIAGVRSAGGSLPVFQPMQRSMRVPPRSPISSGSGRGSIPSLQRYRRERRSCWTSPPPLRSIRRSFFSTSRRRVCRPLTSTAS